MLRSVFQLLCALFFRICFRWQCLYNRNKSIYIFDIDNTIGNTYPTLLNNYSTEKERILSVPPFPRMQKLVSGLLRSPSRKVLFMTSRSYLLWGTTHRWLEGIGINAKLTDVIIVSSPAEKLQLMKAVLPLKNKMTYVDDLSYNHEHNDVKFYEEEILLARNLPLRFIGYKTILQFNSKAETKP